MAQRMESVAPPGGVMLTESTARLVEHAAVLAEPEMVTSRVPIRRSPRGSARHGAEAMAASPCESTAGRPQMGIGTVPGFSTRRSAGVAASSVSRVRPVSVKAASVRELAAPRGGRGVEAFTDLLRVPRQGHPVPCRRRDCCAHVLGVDELDDVAARGRFGRGCRHADPEDLLPAGRSAGRRGTPMPTARDRRGRATPAADASRDDASLARTTDPALHVIEDAHWIDEVSESMLAEFSQSCRRLARWRDHLSPRVPRRTGHDLRRADDCACAP